MRSLALILLFAATPALGEEIPEKARTEGTFRLRYELVRKNGVIVPEKLKVTVRNRQEFFHPPDARLKEHEAVHAQINDNAARRIQSALSAFKSTATLAAAEKALRKRFSEEVQKVRQLHGDWDETSVFVKPDPDATPPID